MNDQEKDKVFSERNAKGKVVGFRADGVFVVLETGERGFVHISEVSLHFVKNIERFCTVGESYDFMIIGEFPDKSYRLSLKRLEEKRVRQSVDRKQVKTNRMLELETYLHESCDVLKGRMDEFVVAAQKNIIHK